MTRSLLLLLLFLCTILTACIKQDNKALFEHNIEDPVKPWSKNSFDNADSKFTFAVFSDLTGGERKDIFNVAVEQLNLFRPELIMNVGDLIEGSTQDPDSLFKEWQYFDDRINRLIAPVFYTGGNHDLTGPVLRKVWAERYGRTYYHFLYKDVLFMVMDTEDISEDRQKEIYEARLEALEVRERDPDSLQYTKYYSMPERLTGGISPEQSEYFQDVIRGNPDVRWSFLFMHKPIWRDSTETDFTEIEDALEGRNYTLFNGHYHTFSHRTRRGMDYIHMGTTGGQLNGSNPGSFDHITLVTVSEDEPSIVHIQMNGILDKTGKLPLNGDSLCFRADGLGCN
ncbi:metallophosphoesterase family protein [Balneola sp. MJW-20]|uniref:metallophosphoesterase family protein n=1 Tax=Gracilimonas aurantiaca TaxID=3234185 RepID=UPI003466E1E6